MAITDREREIYSWPSDTMEQRQAQVDALAALAEDPTDRYDAHHGTDRSDASLAFLAATDPAEHARILRKIEEAKR